MLKALVPGDVATVTRIDWLAHHLRPILVPGCGACLTHRRRGDPNHRSLAKESVFLAVEEVLERPNGAVSKSDLRALVTFAVSTG
jgi:hypothetical protein